MSGTGEEYQYGTDPGTVDDPSTVCDLCRKRVSVIYHTDTGRICGNCLSIKQTKHVVDFYLHGYADTLERDRDTLRAENARLTRELEHLVEGSDALGGLYADMMSQRTAWQQRAEKAERELALTQLAWRLYQDDDYCIDQCKYSPTGNCAKCCLDRARNELAQEAADGARAVQPEQEASDGE